MRVLFCEQVSDSRIRPTRMVLSNGFYFVSLFFESDEDKAAHGRPAVLTAAGNQSSVLAAE